MMSRGSQLLLLCTKRGHHKLERYMYLQCGPLFLRVLSRPVHGFFAPDHKTNCTQTNNAVLSVQKQAGWGAEPPVPAPQIDPIATVLDSPKKTREWRRTAWRALAEMHYQRSFRAPQKKTSQKSWREKVWTASIDGMTQSHPCHPIERPVPVDLLSRFCLLIKPTIIIASFLFYYNSNFTAIFLN